MIRQSFLAATLLAMATINYAHAAPVYLNLENTTVALGASMAAQPFANRTTAASLTSTIDRTSPAALDQHLQSTHVWVSGGNLELDFDFGTEYDLQTFHFLELFWRNLRRR